jgi:thiamine pyrophosphate-dependent acetolactate synthase large subunit-like protein
MVEFGKKEFLDRREVVRSLLAERENCLVVSGLGSPTYDVHATGDRTENFYLWGGMGGACMIGLGLAMSQPKKTIIVITGDGEQLMGVGSLSTIGILKPKNLLIVVLDNEHFGETGMQKSHTFHAVDLVGIASASGCPKSILVNDENSLVKLLEIKKTLSCFTFAVIKVSQSMAPRSLPMVSGVQIQKRFRSSLGLK